LALRLPNQSAGKVAAPLCGGSSQQRSC